MNIQNLKRYADSLVLDPEAPKTSFPRACPVEGLKD